MLPPVEGGQVPNAEPELAVGPGGPSHNSSSSNRLSNRLRDRRTLLLAAGAGGLGVVLIAVAVVLATSGGGGHNAALNGASGPKATARAELLLNVTVVPSDGAINQSPATVVTLKSTGAQLESVEVRALAFRTLLPGQFEEAKHQWHSLSGLQSGTTYAVDYTVKAATGLVATGSGTFTTALPGAVSSGGLSSSPGGQSPTSTPSSAPPTSTPNNPGGSEPGSGLPTSTPGAGSPGSPGSTSPGAGSPGTGSPGTGSPGTGSPGYWLAWIWLAWIWLAWSQPARHHQPG